MGNMRGPGSTGQHEARRRRLAARHPESHGGPRLQHHPGSPGSVPARPPRDTDVLRDTDRIASHVIDLPALDPRAMHKIDTLDKSFWGAVYNTDTASGPCLSLMERRRARVFVTTAHERIGRVLAGLREHQAP